MAASTTALTPEALKARRDEVTAKLDKMRSAAKPHRDALEKIERERFGLKDKLRKALDGEFDLARELTMLNKALGNPTILAEGGTVEISHKARAAK